MFHRIRAIVKALMFVATPCGSMHSFTAGLRACFGLPFTECIEQAARLLGYWPSCKAGGFPAKSVHWPMVDRRAAMKHKQKHNSSTACPGTFPPNCLADATLPSHLSAWQLL